MKRNWNIVALGVILVICNIGLLHATDGVTQKPEVTTAASTAASTAATTKAPEVTTTKPKIDIKNSELCKKCSCDVQYLQIDCSNRSLTNIFSAEEWQTLQNGDVIFEIIKLNHNNISQIPVIPTYPVKSLYLSFNKIDNIVIGAFQNLTQLTTLDLSHNKLTSKSLNPHIFMGSYATDKYMPKESLISLDLAYNEMHTLHSDLFEHLPNLETLILCKNIFRVIDTSTLVAIANLVSLKTLDLSYMELSTIPETMFHTPIELETLILTGNLFQTIPAALEQTSRLKKLVLDENPLKNFEKDNIFKSLEELDYLSISYLPDITEIGSGALSNLKSLTTLIAANNPRLSLIAESAFRKKTANPDIFDYPPLEKLYLHNNNLTTIDRNWIVRWEKVTVLDLRFNPWNCDCSNTWLIHSLIKQINNTTPVLTHDVTCASPSAWKHKTLLELNLNNKELVCENTNHPEKDSLILIGVLVGVLIGIPITLASMAIYKKGCFGLLNRRNRGTDRSLYSRASFADEVHI